METPESPPVELHPIGVLGERWLAGKKSASSSERRGRRGFRAPSDSSDDEEDATHSEPVEGHASASARRAVAPDMICGRLTDEQEEHSIRVKLWETHQTIHEARMDQLAAQLARGRSVSEDYLALAQQESLQRLQNRFSPSTLSDSSASIVPQMEQLLTALKIRQVEHKQMADAKLAGIQRDEQERRRRAEESRRKSLLEEESRQRQATELLQREQREREAREEQQRRQANEEKEKIRLAAEQEAQRSAATNTARKECIPMQPRGNQRSVEFQQVDTLASEFASDFGQKKNRVQLKKLINVCTNQISATQSQVFVKVRDFTEIMTNSKSLGAAAHAFAMRYIAERFVNEGEGQVTDHLESCFPVAAVASALMASSPEIAPVIVGQFHKSSSYTVPVHVPRPPNTTQDDYKILAGFKVGETQENFYRRTSGIVSLYAAITQTNIPPNAGLGQNPLGITKAWEWLAKMCNMKVKKITASILIAFLEVAGYEMHLRYRGQFAKVLDLIQSQLVRQFPADSPPGATARLQVFISEYFENKHRLPEPKGKSMPVSDLESL